MDKGSQPGHISKSKIVTKPKEANQKCKNVKKPDPSPPLKEMFTFESPRFMQIIGPKQIQALSQFIPSAIVFGVASAVCLMYLTEWKTVLRYVPYYGGKYRKPEA